MRRRLIYLLYRLLQAACFPLILVYFLQRGLKDRKYFSRVFERFGFLPRSFRQTAGGALWLHAVSVGEVLSAVELLRRLRGEFPLAPLFVSVTTLAGRALAEDKLRGLADGVFYAPVDYCFAVRRTLRALRPQTVIVLETEIWPNLYREAKRAGCGLLVVNGRISDRAAPRYRALRPFFREVLAHPDVILVQNELSRKRYIEAGAPPERTRVAGNLKYDFDPRRVKVPEAVRAFLERLKPEEIWIAASTMPPARSGDPDEDVAVLEAFRELARRRPGLLLILVPRRPERFDSAAQILREAGVPFLRRSALKPEDTLSLPGVLLVDTIGELSGMFQFADVVFMGGTLPHRGGHNILEPAAFGRPVIVGPHMENFPSIIEEFKAAGAVREIQKSGELAPAVDALLEDAGERASLGERARQMAAAEQGATDRVIAEIRAHHAQTLPRFRPAVAATLALWPLSRLWLLGGHVKRAFALARRARLNTPVISVGGLTVGGAGKTPFVLWLAARLGAAGRRPAILTRGYRRQSTERCTILEPGVSVPASRTGDEAQIYARSGAGPIGISADRAAAGRLVEERFRPGVFLLDDGFQHWRLARSRDIVLIDALDPFGGGDPFPLGRLRESLNALARADLIVLTRCERSRPAAAIEERIRRYNRRAPVFRSRVAPQAWVDARSGEERPAGGLRLSNVAAFCGLANPASFWQSLAALGCRPVFRRVFPDHHRYGPADLEELAAAARQHSVQALLTTEKDFVNLCAGWPDLLESLPLFWLRIGVEVEGEQALLEAIESALAPR